jgi:hypothetical protein
MSIYHYVCTLQWSIPAGGVAASSFENTLEASDGATRQQMFRVMIDDMKEKLGRIGEGAVVLFFSLEPNDLGIGTEGSAS